MGSIKYIAALLTLMSIPAHAQAPAKGQMLTALPSASLPLGGNEWMYLVQGDQDRKSPASSIGQILWNLPGVWTMPQTFDVTPGTNPLVINGNAGTPPTALGSTILQIVGQTGAPILADSFAGNASFNGRRANGTMASPSGVTVNNTIAAFSGYGYGATGYSPVARVIVSLKAAENWTDTAQGTMIDFIATATGGTATTAAMRLQDSGTLTIGATAASGAAKLQVTGGTLTDKASVGAGLLNLSSGELGISKIAASGVAPGSSGGKLSLVCGTNPGTAKLVITAGTSTTPSTVVDNIGAGVAGC